MLPLQSAVPATFSLPFPYCGSHAPSDRYKNLVFEQWRLEGHARLPDPLPEGWRLIPCEHDGDYSIRDWAHYVPRMPIELFDIGWELENAYHLLGPFIPLVRSLDYRVFAIGGLLLAWPIEEFLLLAWPIEEFLPEMVSTGLSTDELLQEIEEAESIGRRIGAFYNEDEVAREVGMRYRDIWVWEIDHLDRNRWKEFEERGGDVHTDWTVNALREDIDD